MCIRDSIKRPPGDISFILVQRFGELLRKLWNPKNFKAHVSPHEMLQAVVLCSKKKFQIELDKLSYGSIKTEIILLDKFYLAEDYHQKYLHKNPNGYCGLKGTGAYYT